ncbi:TPA: hypothetical protein NIA45_004730 [Pseudomonas aeruginosa]|nr:hypothetical protein [Pseudomonas aeruginosa]
MTYRAAAIRPEQIRSGRDARSLIQVKRPMAPFAIAAALMAVMGVLMMIADNSRGFLTLGQHQINFMLMLIGRPTAYGAMEWFSVLVWAGLLAALVLVVRNLARASSKTKVASDTADLLNRWLTGRASADELLVLDADQRHYSTQVVALAYTLDGGKAHVDAICVDAGGFPLLIIGQVNDQPLLEISQVRSPSAIQHALKTHFPKQCADLSRALHLRTRAA